MTMTVLENEPVQRVRKALTGAGLADSVFELDATARSAGEAAAAIGCDLGAIVKSLVFAVDQRLVMALIAGDQICNEAALGPALNLQGEVHRPQASEVKGATGFSIGGVAPIGLAHRLPVVIDRSLKRFDAIYAAAGHPHCVFKTDVATLSRLTGGIISQAIGLAGDSNSDGSANSDANGETGAAGSTATALRLRPSRSFAENRQQRAR
jgi:prolyl-tRNA editing enzyme YbaK/EbsC (Cys-tRNA(Pro) deacylase)